MREMGNAGFSFFGYFLILNLPFARATNTSTDVNYQPFKI